MPDVRTAPQAKQKTTPDLQPIAPFESRVLIEGVEPEVDLGRFPAKRILGETVEVFAHIHSDGHEVLCAVVHYRPSDAEAPWTETRMSLENIGLDRWLGSFTPKTLGRYEFSLFAWISRLGTWKRDILKKIAAHQEVDLERQEGLLLLKDALNQGAPFDQRQLASTRFLNTLIEGLEKATTPAQVSTLLDAPEVDEQLFLWDPRPRMRHYPAHGKPPLQLVIDPPKALFSAWYELFPRSAGAPGSHGTFLDVIEKLPEIARMGFDVLYLPPIHPIGLEFRKGPNNSLVATKTDPGSPWAIGGEGGGHRAIHAQLGTLDDFQKLLKAAKGQGIDLALDIAFQCSPDHPYVKDHPEWFHHRPDGSIKYAENPPKKYQDIYPFNFECDGWESLWQELTDVVRYWCQQGVRIFRVDNPHTKPFDFWEYLINTIKGEFPDAIFLAEAFTRPSIMHYLAKCGFTQSYTYFTWRNTKAELMEYLQELTSTPTIDYKRPNFFANTPDINPEYLQFGGPNAYKIRATLAATLSSVYGIYGPVFELCHGDALPNSEEYNHSEKYELRQWDWDQPGHIKDYIARINRIRFENSSLQQNRRLTFHPTDNDQLLCFSKVDATGSNRTVMVVNLDPHHAHAGWVDLPIDSWGIDGPYQMHDLISGCHYIWHGHKNYVQLNPFACPAHIFTVRRKVRTEHDFDYFL